MAHGKLEGSCDVFVRLKLCLTAFLYLLHTKMEDSLFSLNDVTLRPLEYEDIDTLYEWNATIEFEMLSAAALHQPHCFLFQGLIRGLSRCQRRVLWSSTNSRIFWRRRTVSGGTIYANFSRHCLNC
jgi:hypothetical protein